MAELATAAFFRAEGPLLPSGSLLAAAWMAANAQRVRGRLVRLGAVALAAPIALSERGTATRVGWAALRGTSEDRLVVLGEEYWEARLKERLVEVGLRLVDEARRAGHQIVLVSDHPDVIARHAADAIGADALVCNRLELRDGRATGRLCDPVVGSALSGQWAREWAAGRGVSVERSLAYGAHADDAILLSAVGRPCAVRPDRALRRAARDLSWPVVDA